MNWSRFVFRLTVAGLAGLQGFARGEEPAHIRFDGITLGKDTFYTGRLEKKGFEPLSLNPQVQWLDGQGWNVEVSGIGDGNEMGVALKSVDGAIRSQLGLPEGQGLVVLALAPDGPAARVGLSRNDVLLALDDKSLSKPSDLTDYLKAAGDKTVTIRLLRGGKTVLLSAKPAYKVTLSPVVKESHDYYIGVTSEPVDETLRSQLNLEPDGGVVARSIEPDSPAAKAGLKDYDVLISIGEHKLKNRDVFVEEIQASKGKSLQLKLLRSGKPLNVEVAPVIRPQSDSGPVYTISKPVAVYRVLRSAPPVPAIGTRLATITDGTTPTATSTEKQLEEMVKELKELHLAVEKLQRSIQEKDNAGSSKK